VKQLKNGHNVGCSVMMYTISKMPRDNCNFVLVTIMELRKKETGVIAVVAALNEDKVDFKYMLVLPKTLFTADVTAFSQCRVPHFKTFCKYGA
jgi:hypothetical protein